ncbi:hypothetical protein ODJ79_23890 [Actinoplanes sp. KI2]|uniref:hypothetical protein n=1 Tax=Actinoplanes sp. KI2 TaxID=2983315 RepID=UPI0021D57978|nr:hypothetical protein [Actinoplanes sp. KI2]MCU7726783.1 hypothetical protein [Actinoplanes sp. KI2]
MIGETPQPGEKPSNEGNPWSFSDPNPGWWRGETDRAATDPPTGRQRRPRRRAPQHQEEAAAGVTGTLLPPGEAGPRRSAEQAEAHAAGVRDTTRHLDPDTEPPVVERRHDQLDEHRYDPLRPPARNRSRRASATAAAPVTAKKPPAETKPAAATPTAKKPPAGAEAGAAEPATAESARPEMPPGEVADWAVEITGEHKTVDAEGKEPDVMVLPEPSARSRPTVPLESATPPGTASGVTKQNRRVLPNEPLPRATGDPETDARLERMENSPFWHTDPEQLPEPAAAEEPTPTATRRGARQAAPHTPIGALASLIALGLVAAFFAWVSAEPFWLAVGHGTRGYATVTSCTGSGLTQHCVGPFAAADGSYLVSRVTLLGVEPGHRVPGAVAAARMVSPDSPRAYLGNTSPLLELRWILGFLMVLLCGWAIASVTGARRLETRTARRGAVLASLAGPVLLLAGFLIAAF